MEEKYPIKFTLGQFVLLLATQLVILALIFLLGARFGTSLFPQYDTSPAGGVAANATRSLVGTLDPALEEDKTETDTKNAVPVYAIDADGQRQEQKQGDQEDVDGSEKQPYVADPSHNPVNKDTLIRFKSSGHSKFSVEVGRYYDELVASKQVSTLKQKGYEAFLVINTDNKQMPYAVRIGSFGDRTSADAFAAQLSNEQGLELRVVQVDS